MAEPKLGFHRVNGAENENQTIDHIEYKANNIIVSIKYTEVKSDTRTVFLDYIIVRLEAGHDTMMARTLYASR